MINKLHTFILNNKHKLFILIPMTTIAILITLSMLKKIFYNILVHKKTIKLNINTPCNIAFLGNIVTITSLDGKITINVEYLEHEISDNQIIKIHYKDVVEITNNVSIAGKIIDNILQATNTNNSSNHDDNAA